MLTSLRKDRMKLAKNYALYYGENGVNELKSFDIVIVEPKATSVQEVEHLQSFNTLVFFYLSMLEVHPTEPIFKELTEEDFIFVNGKPYINEEYGTYLVSLQSRKWIEYLLKQVHKYIQVFHADGLFLDTIGDLESVLIPLTIHEQQLQGAVHFLYALKMLYPKNLFIQNNGLETVCLQTAPYIDGVCWENPPLTLTESKEWVELITKRLKRLQDQFQMKILLLIEETMDKERNAYMNVRKFAKEHNFLLYHASNKYVDGVNIIKG
ncbi:MAG: hypothetical protein Q8934_10370 [Bacillota bacterium]|nr:hypothetical protein [Bacillota bacterium]